MSWVSCPREWAVAIVAGRGQRWKGYAGSRQTGRAVGHTTCSGNEGPRLVKFYVWDQTLQSWLEDAPSFGYYGHPYNGPENVTLGRKMEAQD